MEENGRIIGIDFGSKRIGVAVSDPMRIIAQGLCVVPNKDDAVSRICKIAEEQKAGAVVIGIPLTLKGDKGKTALEVEEFARKLEAGLSVPLVRQDERFTTTIAHRTLRSMNTGRQERRDRNRIDLMAAALILQAYLDQMNLGKRRKEEL